jgi:hypothetical protein
MPKWCGPKDIMKHEVHVTMDADRFCLQVGTQMFHSTMTDGKILLAVNKAFQVVCTFS